MNNAIILPSAANKNNLFRLEAPPTGPITTDDFTSDTFNRATDIVVLILDSADREESIVKRFFRKVEFRLDSRNILRSTITKLAIQEDLLKDFVKKHYIDRFPRIEELYLIQNQHSAASLDRNTWSMVSTTSPVLRYHLEKVGYFVARILAASIAPGEDNEDTYVQENSFSRPIDCYYVNFG
ncbi:hypothetical protein VTL71DRAFT_844 [Oculimacula yallundae]|uniref:Uncharacterized protein n=1 Tax=Oculimacula yallundae TaxID=86028 RepID=A0ABR4D3H0_9HELO